MKYSTFWVEEKHTIVIDDEPREITLLVGSANSKAAATRDAALKAEKIAQRIAQRRNPEEYDVGIREHVDEVISDSNIVSVCRYGAKVLNTDAYTILDLDDYARSFWDRFKPVDNLTKKERIIYKFEEFVGKHPRFGTDFRVYETAKGIRVIGKQYLDPTQKRTMRAMRKLNVDWLYAVLSRKQRCYRARLTPKPYRLKIKTIKVRSPLICETDAYADWAKMYEAASRGHSVAHFVKAIGSDFSNDPVIRLHDQRCNTDKDYQLA